MWESGWLAGEHRNRSSAPARLVAACLAAIAGRGRHARRYEAVVRAAARSRAELARPLRR